MQEDQPYQAPFSLFDGGLRKSSTARLGNGLLIPVVTCCPAPSYLLTTLQYLALLQLHYALNEKPD